MELLDYAASSELVGRKVTDSLGHDYGKVIDILFSSAQNRALAVVIDTGGLYSSQSLVLPFQAIRINPNTRHITHEINKQTISEAPMIDLEELRAGNEEALIRLYNYYGYERIWEEPGQEAAPLHENNRSGNDTGEHHPANEGSYQITKQNPGPKGSNTKEEVNYNKIKGLPEENK